MALKNGNGSSDHRHSRQGSPDYAGHVPKHDLLRERLQVALHGDEVKISAALSLANKQRTDFDELLSENDKVKVRRVFSDLRYPVPK